MNENYLLKSRLKDVINTANNNKKFKKNSLGYQMKLSLLEK